MDYERIHKVQQSGIISPSKLRLKLLGPQNHKAIKDLSKSKDNSPSRIQVDTEFVKNSLLAVPNGHFEEQESVEVPPMKCDSSSKDSSQSDGNSIQMKELPPREKPDTGRFKAQTVPKGDTSISILVHPGITYEDEIPDYDSTSSFEFQKGERSLHHSLNRSLSRPASSKWNDAEKWIMNKQSGQPNFSKKPTLQNRPTATNMVRLLLENGSSGNKSSVKKVDFCQTGSNMGKPSAVSGYGNGVNQLIEMCPESKDLKEVETTALPCTKSVTEENIVYAGPAIRSVSMRDMGTEMTPIPSQEPSRSATPVSSTTPLRSPTTSLPSTPRRREPGPTPIEQPIRNATQHVTENGKTEFSEQELKFKTRREIVALGVQLGKMNIAEWASEDGKGKSILDDETDLGELGCIENEKRAAAWEEAEKSKHTARFKREEIRIEAWESREKAKLEAEMRKVEAKAEQRRAQAQANTVKKIAMASQRAEEKRAAAEARKNRQAEKTAAQADYIRQTGRVPSSSFICCGWS